MDKKRFSPKDVETALQKHPDYSSVQGVYFLISNGVALNNQSEGFFCTEEAFSLFIDQVIKTVLLLNIAPADKTLKEWVPIPGVEKEELVDRYSETPEIYGTLIEEDPNVIVIRKAKDAGCEIIWSVQDGGIGSGATLN